MSLARSGFRFAEMEISTCVHIDAHALLLTTCYRGHPLDFDTPLQIRDIGQRYRVEDVQLCNTYCA